MNCPKCKCPLTVKTIKDVSSSIEVDYCNTCGGMWFDKGELSKVDRIVEPVFFEIRHLPKKAEQLKALNCPVCGNMQILQKAEHPRDNKVILDYCPSCKGIWLDKNELEAIQKETWIVTVKNLFRSLSSSEN